MSLNRIRDLFPSLRNFKITSDTDPRYNCIAWAAQDTQHWWQPAPDFYWPLDVTFDATEAGCVAAFESLGYISCDNGDPECGFEKVAIYESHNGGVSHMARQLPSGKWTSKLGQLEDIEHENPDELEGEQYGTVTQYMKRAYHRPPSVD